MKRIAITVTLITAALAAGCANTGRYEPRYEQSGRYDRGYERPYERTRTYHEERPRYVNTPVYEQEPAPASAGSGNWLPQAAGAAAGSMIGGNMNGGGSTSANCR